MRRTVVRLAWLAAACTAEELTTLWPYPASVHAGDGTHPICPGLRARLEPASRDLERALGRFRAHAFAHGPHGGECDARAIAELRVRVRNARAELQAGVDESYELKASCAAAGGGGGGGGGGCAIDVDAATQFGAFHALTTLAQLVSYDFASGAYALAGMPLLRVRDAPRFAHRELLVDSARHWLAPAALGALVDAMAMAKLNVLHWHLSDSTSFPLCLRAAPALCAAGAFSARERYARADVARLVAHAAQRGVRVLAELDVPGHAASWCRGYPRVCPAADCAEPLNPARADTFALLEALLDELLGAPAGGGASRGALLPERLLHLGGDEVDTRCWEASDEIIAWLRARGLSAADAYGRFVLRAHELAAARGAVVVGWDEIFEALGGTLPRSTIVQVWRPWSRASSLANVTAAGLRALSSPDPAWYLDSLDVNWTAAYAHEPCDGLSAAQCARVVGGGGAMWGERADGSDVEATVWPRLAAIAERLWSPRARSETARAEPRLRAFRCLLLARGVAAAPVGNARARDAPRAPGGCAEQ
ncbi:hypothetical protein KFE25_004600 [Diacronema lutheri]|uniref:Beta-hexosaminidase n=1 Tax=Diacronema lutheri TaxID=2081491 RepID=A0A8J6C7B5_DIALT|nr:hypothetical protein KFE25_004600 [Diacronema lutheri]